MNEYLSCMNNISNRCKFEEKCKICLLYLVLDDGFRCSSFHCRTELYQKGTDYGYYSSNTDCTACKILCAANKDCGGVDCEGNQGCIWWRAGVCGLRKDQSRDDPDYRTCMKYDKGIDSVLDKVGCKGEK